MSDIGSQLISTVVLLGTAMVAVPLFKKLGLGSVLGYLAGGLLIGPFGFGLFGDPDAILHFAELGVVMFLFLVGLEMNPAHLWKLRQNIFGLGLSQVALACSLMTIIGMLVFKVNFAVAFVCSASFSLSSSAIVMQLLNERGQMNTQGGQRIFSILLFEDLMIVPFLAMVAFFAPNETKNATPLWQSIITAIVAIGALLVAGKFVLNPLFSLLAKAKSREIMTASALFVVLGSAILMEQAGLSMAMGAFVAGVLLSESSFRHQLEADIEPFRGLLLGLFFLGVGMSLDLAVVAQNWQMIAVGVLCFMLAKGVCVFTVAKIAKNPTPQALERAFLMSHGGEFAFVLLSSASAQKVISDNTEANMTAIIVLSMAMMSLLVVVHQKWIAPKFKDVKNEREADEIFDENPILLIGMGRFGQIVADVLLMSGKSLTIIDRNPKMVDGMTKYGVKTHFGDGTRPEILQSAGIQKAKLVIIATESRERTNHIVANARKLNPDIKILARAYDRTHTYDLHKIGANSAVRELFDSSLRAGKTALEMLGMDKETSKKISDLYFRRDRHMIFKMVEHYDPELEPFQNSQMMEQSQKYDAVTKAMIRDLIDGKEVVWVEDDKEAENLPTSSKKPLQK